MVCKKRNSIDMRSLSCRHKQTTTTKHQTTRQPHTHTHTHTHIHTHSHLPEEKLAAGEVKPRLRSRPFRLGRTQFLIYLECAAVVAKVKLAVSMARSAEKKFQEESCQTTHEKDVACNKQTVEVHSKREPIHINREHSLKEVCRSGHQNSQWNKRPLLDSTGSSVVVVIINTAWGGNTPEPFLGLWQRHACTRHELCAEGGER